MVKLSSSNKDSALTGAPTVLEHPDNKALQYSNTDVIIAETTFSA